MLNSYPDENRQTTNSPTYFAQYPAHRITTEWSRLPELHDSEGTTTDVRFADGRPGMVIAGALQLHVRVRGRQFGTAAFLTQLGLDPTEDAEVGMVEVTEDGLLITLSLSALPSDWNLQVANDEQSQVWA